MAVDMLEVVYIEYQDRLPHSVILSNGGYCRVYDFDFVYGDKKDIRYKWSGSGGSIKEIQAPHYVKGSGAEYWMREDAGFKGKPKNIKRIDKPHRIVTAFGSSLNPFKVSDETNEIIYCRECDQRRIEECPQHQYWDDEACVIRYVSDDAEAE